MRGKLPAPCAANCSSPFLGMGRAPCAGCVDSAPAMQCRWALIGCASHVWAPLAGSWECGSLPASGTDHLSSPPHSLPQISCSPSEHCGPISLASACGPRTPWHIGQFQATPAFAACKWNLSYVSWVRGDTLG